ncbi:hypothetical protein V8G57_15570 [Collimonas sp. H4R21]|uniref:Uncharacterized protein n=1 Tax=Collimonas rhizosphaerae TaxID=3126357 RepID=A0ABU9PXS3_9BURK
MSATARYFNRHPFQGGLLIVILFCAVTALEHDDEVRAEAYQAGLLSGMKLAEEINVHDSDIGLQLADLCGQEWRDVPNAKQAKKRACGPL